MPKVSVIIPTYNRAELLKVAIASVLSQTYKDFEIIVIDDASHDNTQELLTSLKDKRIRYIRHETNKRISAARNTGIVNSHGNYIAFLDDDDEWLPEKLQLQVDFLENSPPIIGVVYTGFYKIDKASGKILEQITPTKKGFIFGDLIAQNWVGTSTVLLRRECFKKVGLFDESVGFGEDYDIWIRISKEFHFVYLKEPLVNYYIHDVSSSVNYTLMIEGFESQIRKYAPFFALDSKRYSSRYLQLGVVYCHNGDIKKGRRALLKAIRLYPLGVRNYCYLFLCLLGSHGYKKGIEVKEKITGSVKNLIGRYGGEIDAR